MIDPDHGLVSRSKLRASLCIIARSSRRGRRHTVHDAVRLHKRNLMSRRVDIVRKYLIFRLSGPARGVAFFQLLSIPIFVPLRDPLSRRRQRHPLWLRGAVIAAPWLGKILLMVIFSIVEDWSWEDDFRGNWMISHSLASRPHSFSSCLQSFIVCYATCDCDLFLLFRRWIYP